MKKAFKGFTLVECIIAMAILAIASTLMAEIYATVSKRNNFNHFMNTSLANQMAYIEKYTDSESVPIYFGGLDSSKKPQKDTELDGTTPSRKPPHEYVSSNNGTTAYVQIQKINKDGDVVTTSETFGTTKGVPQYSFPVDIFVMYSRDTSNDASGKAKASSQYEREDNTAYSQRYSEKNNNLRYKYILGHAVT